MSRFPTCIHRIVIVLMGSLSPVVPAAEKALDTAKIEEIVGIKGTLNEAEGVFKVTRPRGDVEVNVDGAALDPFRGLTSWAAFQDGKTTEAMVMGDIVLFQDEVNPAMSAALDNGLTVTALHNHFFFDEPKVYFMHIGGEGTTSGLAKGVRRVFDAADEIRKRSPRPAKGFGLADVPRESSISSAPLEEILGVKGTKKKGMFKAVVGRTVTMECGCKVGAAMGVNTWAVFAGSDERAVVDGDFACLPGELQPTLKTLRQHDINIVAIHNHMEEEHPRVIFLHYWGVGPARDLATAIRATLDAQRNVERHTHEHKK